MIKKRKVFKKNQGNSFIVVVATISFLAVLVAALLVAVALCYRLKAYDINARDNFYYLERAMDEIYAGVGQHSMEHLNQAYDDTLEVLVYYDSTTNAYTTMPDEEANKLLKDTFMYLVKKDDRYTSGNIKDTLYSFLSNPYGKNNPEGVQLDVKNSVYNSATDRVEITDLTLVREAKYSTVNARSGANSAAADTFIQSITTDLMIGKPEFDVNFNQGASALNDLYSFAMLADMGIEITGKGDNTAYGDRVDITGDIYAASDFYNKDYNELEDKDKVVPADTEKSKVSKITSYKKGETRYTNCNGVSLKSMYSGLYIDGANVLLMADKLIVPGTIAAMNCADLSISSYDESSRGFSEIWADSVVLGGYSLRRTLDGSSLKGSNINMKGRAYISDDLELNANSATFSMNGEYYGYNYATTDNRKYTSSVEDKNQRSFSSTVDKGFTDGKGIEGQAHYNSSAIILNGENTSLDLEAVAAMYVAGQSYIEVSKDKTTEPQRDADGNILTDKDTGKPIPKTQEVTYTVTEGELTNKNGDSVTDTFEVDKYDYTGVVTDGKGNAVDNYTTYTDEKGNSQTTARQDYRTGEAISVKSNQLAYQLAYIPNAMITDDGTDLYVKLPKVIQDVEPYKSLWGDISEIPIIKSVVSGNTYYFFDFSKAKQSTGMNEFIAAYADLFTSTTPDVQSFGASNNLMDITNYAYFQVKMLHLYQTNDDGTAVDQNPYAKIYTNSAITVAEGKTFNIKARSDSIAPLLAAANNINAASAAGSRGTSIATGDGSGNTRTDASVMASEVTTQLQSQYKEMKWLLSNKSIDAKAVQEAHDLQESLLSPVNYFINMSGIDAGKDVLGYTVSQSGSGEGANATNDVGVWISDGDITIGATGFSTDGGQSKQKYEDSSYYTKRKAVLEGSTFDNGIVQGLVIAKGDVTFEDDVNQFNGMIISGGKIIINNFGTKNSMKISADRHMIERILSALDLRRGDEARCGDICDLFRLFESQYKPPAAADDTLTESMKSIAAVEFEDILSFENWMKNVKDVEKPADPATP